MRFPSLATISAGILALGLAVTSAVADTNHADMDHGAMDHADTDRSDAGHSKMDHSKLPLRPDDHAPIGVMGDHVHHPGGFMLSYRYGHMGMGTNFDGTTRVSPAEILADGYMAAPTAMDTGMHVFGAMYAPMSRLSLMLMVPYVTKSMDHVMMGGTRFTTESDGVGDLKITGLIGILNSRTHRLHANLGVSVPTGSIDERDFVPMGGGQVARLPYPMQIGSGTTDVLLGLTYAGFAEAWSWGFQGNGTLRTGKNDNEYRLGDAYDLSLWAGLPIFDWMSASVRLQWKQWFDIEGADPLLNPAAVPTADPDLRAGRRLDFLVGVNFLLDRTFLEGLRLAVEGGIPVYQDLDGPQLGLDWKLVAGIQYAWDSKLALGF